MKRMALLLTSALLVTTAGCGAGAQEWTGKISDSLCAETHMWDEHALPASDQDCVFTCIRQGSQYVFVSNGTVYAIQNQDHPDLATYAGRTVRFSGRLTGETITVSTIEMSRF